MSRRIGRAQALAGALAVTAAAILATTAPAAADANPNVQVSTLAQPDSDDALLNILTEQGVDYEPVTDAISAFNAGGPETTLVIDEDESLSRSDLDLLASAHFARIILLTRDPGTLNEFFPGADISTSRTNASADIAAACTEPNDMATSAGAIESPGPLFTYALPDGTAGQACYPVGGSPSMIELHSGPDGGVPGGTDMILLGSTAFLENQYLADDGNADLAMRIFGAHQTLVWLATTFTNDSTLDCQNTQCTGGGNGSGATGGGNGNSGNGGGTTTTVTPQPGQNTASQPTLTSMLPSWIWWVLAQIVLAVLLFAYWRARRQGRIVAEPLPVTVRAAETVEGHARLYRRAGAFGHSARLLRQASAGRLAPVFGLPQARAEADPRLLVGPIAARLGTDPARVGGLLAGPDPTSEAELVLLADHLDQLEQEVRSS
jgi:hypothetical protein